VPPLAYDLVSCLASCLACGLYILQKVLVLIFSKTRIQTAANSEARFFSLQAKTYCATALATIKIRQTGGMVKVALGQR